MSNEALAKPGVLLQVLGQGVLLQGGAGVGKSDLALGLVARGHALVADDRVEFVRDEQGHLQGRGRPGFEGFLAVRGLGVVNVYKLYNKAACVTQTPIDLVVQLQKTPDTDGLSPSLQDWSLLGCHIPAWSLAVDSGRDLPLLVETMVRLNRLALQGYDASTDLQSRLAQLLREEKP